jgi:predicted transcriptional regulator
MTGEDLRQKRRQGDVPGEMVCRRAGISRSRLSAIERGHITPSSDEARRLAAAIEELAAVRKRIVRFASRLGFRELF